MGLLDYLPGQRGSLPDVEGVWAGREAVLVCQPNVHGLPAQAGHHLGRRLVFHSLRKNFASALDRAGVPLADAAALLGHSRGFSWDVYSSGPGLQRLHDLVERVEYEGIT